MAKLTTISIILTFTLLTCSVSFIDCGDPSLYCAQERTTFCQSNDISPCYCWFSKENEKKIKIAHIQVPEKNTWPQEIDSIDCVIFNCYELPYTYASIKKTPDINVYVLKAEYALSCLDTKAWLTGRKQKIQERTQHDQLLHHENSKKVIARITEYLAILNIETSYDHKCVGLIVPKRALLCIAQVSCAKQAAQKPQSPMVVAQGI